MPVVRQMTPEMKLLNFAKFMSYPEIKIHLIVQIAVKPFLVVCDSLRESYDGTPGSKINVVIPANCHPFSKNNSFH